MTTVASRVIPHTRPHLGQEEIDAVSAVLSSGYIAEGPQVEQLEKEWCVATGTAGAVAVGSGLAAIRLSLISLGIRAGDEVIVPAYGCVSILNAILAAGATPVFSDVRRDDWTLDPAAAQQARTARTRAIIAVHLFGMPAAMAELQSLGVPIVEDCAHGIGGMSARTPFGASGTLSIASFYATKMIAAGEGGIVASRETSRLQSIRSARNPSDQGPNAHHLNDKMTDIEAAIARVQLRRLPATLERRRTLAARYTERLAPLAGRELLVLPREVPGRIWYRYAVRLTRHRALDVAQQMQRGGVFADTPVWDLRPAVKWSGRLSESDLALDHLLSLPLYADLREDDQERVVTALTEALR